MRSSTSFPWVIAIRTNAPGITIGPYEDIKYLRLAIADRFVQRFGDVQCAIQTGLMTTAGRKPDLSEEVPFLCQRTANGVTVMIGGGGFEGPAGVQRIVALTDAAGQAVAPLSAPAHGADVPRVLRMWMCVSQSSVPGLRASTRPVSCWAATRRSSPSTSSTG